MSSNNRGDRIQLLQKVLKKYYKPITATEGRNVLEQLVFASCLEDARYEAAEEAFQRIQELYFDWNEVRVTTVTELADALKSLPDPTAAAARIKRSLQSIFETRYSFDLEDMHKMNQGKAIQEMAKFSGVSRYMLGYVIQHAFGGHTIPVSNSIMNILIMTGIVTPAEAEKHQTPGLERAVPKSKGIEVASCLQQLAAEAHVQPQSKNIKAILKEAGATEPKPQAKPAPVAKSALKAKKPEGKPEGKPESKAESKPGESKKAEAKAHDIKPEPKAAEKSGKPAAKDSKATKSPSKEVKPTKSAKPAQKPIVTKKSAPPKKLTSSKSSSAKKPVVKKITKRKPK